MTHLYAAFCTLLFGFSLFVPLAVFAWAAKKVRQHFSGMGR